VIPRGIRPALVFLFLLAPVNGLACVVRVDDPEVVFPVEKMDRPALCRVAEVVNDYTTHRNIPPILTPIQKTIYDFLVDHPVLTSVLVRRLELAGYRLTRMGPDRWHGDDGLGAEGLITPLYQDVTRRIYHMKGSHRGRLFPEITGEAIVMLNYHAKTGADGREYVETRITTYSRLDNPVLAILVKLLQPVLRGVVNEKLSNAFIVVHRLGELMAVDPERVYRQVESAQEADAADVEALRALLLPTFKKG
jgi:hypothetical protein